MIKFNNNQRDFVTEAESNESIFFKSSGKNSQTRNNIITDERLKIRLRFNAASDFYREILLTVDERSTDAIDKGFAAIMEIEQPNDMYWQLEEGKLIIQAIDNLPVDRVVPIGIKSMGDGPIEIKVDTIENPYPNMEVYLRDNNTMDTYDIKNGSFKITLEEGQYNDKYSIVFKPKVEIEEEEENEVVINEVLIFIGEYNELLKIRKPGEMIIRDISMFNIIGQQIKVWNANLDANEIDLPIHVDAGVYIVMLNTNKGAVHKKVIIK
jgi:hypothetical protein